MSEEQLYCVTAEERLTKKRKDMTGAMSHVKALSEKTRLNRQSKKDYRYFHVAKFPYVATEK